MDGQEKDFTMSLSVSDGVLRRVLGGFLREGGFDGLSSGVGKKKFLQ